MQKTIMNISFLVFTGLVMLLSVWGPETLARYKDKTILDVKHEIEVEATGEGYRYTLNKNEKLFILSKCLNSQILPGSDQNALSRSDAAELDYQELTGTYAFVLNHKEPSEKEITNAEIYESTNRMIETFKELGILPDTVQDVEASSYDAVSYSAIDVLEPRNHVAVWKVSLSNSQKNMKKENRLIDAYMDADDGKIYEFYARTSLTWEEINPDAMIKTWSEYMGLSDPLPYETENPLLETTPYFKKYEFKGMGEEKTIVTIGFYDGINELFLKISK